MTIGQKIAHLRGRAGLSQEQLGKRLGVSRQCVSKWESGATIPSLEAVIGLGDLFSISSDDLLRDDVIVNRDPKPASAEIQNKYFGTDGFRGEANCDLTCDQAYKVGRFIGWYFSSPLSGCKEEGYRPRVVIGKDTRRSSYMFEYAIAAGLAASGADAHILHVTTSPSVAYITKTDDFDCGIMITASHNPFYDNGIKIINRNGKKFDDLASSYIEAYLDGDLASLGVYASDLPLAKRERIGCIVDDYAGRNRYTGYLISLATHSYSNLRIGLDCANGAAWSIAESVFEALGAKVTIIGNEPNGLNVNKDCGSTHLESLKKLVVEKGLDVGFAFDGDADRCMAVDEKGNEIDGDKILYILARRLARKDMLNGNTVVTTIMSNSGLSKSLAKIGIKNVQTNVGDRFVYEEMQKHGYCLGGEQSGHIIVSKYATTGDGILTAILLTEEMISRKSSLGALAKDATLFPQVLKNVRVLSKEAVLEDETILSALASINKEIGGNGRILLRKSGTEPVVRIMVEAPTKEECDRYVERMARVIDLRGYTHE